MHNKATLITARLAALIFPTTLIELDARRTFQNSIDIPFSVPFVHRLRVTDDVAGDDFAQLLGVLEGGDAGPAKVLMVAEQHWPIRLRESARFSQQLKAADSVQLVAEPC